MDQTDFGQIEIYNNLFSKLNVRTIKHTPRECIDKKLSYCGLFNRRELPIMIGSKFDKNENPLKIKGYFIIDGNCMSINNIKINQKISFSRDRAYLLDNSRIDIKDMFHYTRTLKGVTKKWGLPINWREILKFSKHANVLEKHLCLITDESEKIESETDLITLCYMFECWLGLREEPKVPWRLLTAGEIIYDAITSKQNVVNCFRVSTWSLKQYSKVYTVSEHMKHYNLTYDIESIRRITLPGMRENTSMKNRQVKYEDKYKICPVQTSDGSLCGTVNYLCRNAKIVNKIEEQPEIIKGNIHVFLNDKYIGKCSEEYINKAIGEKIRIDELCFINNQYGRVIKGDSILSYTASLIPHVFNNPPARAMFTCSMIKQAITGDSRLNDNLISNTKTLINGELGHKLNVAIMPWYGYNVEDAIVISKSTARKFRSRKCTILKETKSKIIGVYVKTGCKIIKGQVLYKKYTPTEIKTIDWIHSEVDGVVEELVNKPEYFKLVIIKMKEVEIGDKMTSRHGQKGIVSLIEDDHDMPYYYDENEREIKIDLLINPHAFPSRMTMGQIKEMGEKEVTMHIHDITCKNKIIAGECLYMALRHQVADKVQFRNSGRVDLINKQPVAGKKNIGGIRFGQMERDILIGLGCWKTIKELWSIDKTNIYVCPKTGEINTKCCRKVRESHQYFKICLGYLRALGYDILIKDNKYSIKGFNHDKLPKTDTLNFGDLDPLDLRMYEGNVVLPYCLRSELLNRYYNYNHKNINKEIRKLLKSKSGVYHTLVEGHRIDKCIRSVITPNPELPIDTVEIPFGANIGTNYGILNRQPSLNVNSLKIVKLKQSNNKTISFNPLLCKSFNADFDGDEMNIYGIVDSVDELKEKLIVKEDKTQDYILGDLVTVTEEGLTANKEGVKRMIKNKSKGSDFNYKHMFEEIGDVAINGKIQGHITEGYNGNITEDDWYLLCMAARESTASIGVNTPVTGHLENICNQMYI